jgi:hypothetical protein
MHLVSVEPAVQLRIGGILNLAVIHSIHLTIAEIFDATKIHGVWTITISASDTRGRWDVAWRGPGVRHVSSFASSAAALQETVCGHLRDRVNIVQRSATVKTGSVLFGTFHRSAPRLR